MALIDDIAAYGLPAALVGVGAVLVAPLVLPVVGSVARPVAKGAIKGYLALVDGTKEWFAEASEQWSDLVAEAKAEHAATPAEHPRHAAHKSHKAAAHA